MRSGETSRATPFLSERTLMAHMRSVFTKPGLVDDGTTHRRVLAVITYLGSQRREASPSRRLANRPRAAAPTPRP